MEWETDKVRLSLEEAQLLWAKVPRSEREEAHYFLCAECGQAVDAHNFADVLYHDEAGHARMSRH